MCNLTNNINIKSIDKLNIPKVYKNNIKEILPLILSKNYTIYKIVLFGSCAREEVQLYRSDIDLFIIADYDSSIIEDDMVKAETELGIDNMIELYAIQSKRNDSIDDMLDFDIIVMTPSKYKSALKNTTTITRDIRDKGVILYEKGRLF